jgi:hypothetical protein
MFRVVVTVLAVPVFFATGCGSGGGGATTDPNAQSKPTWTATVPQKSSPDAGPSKQAALRVALAVYAQSFGPDEHSYKNQCFGGSKPEAGWTCYIDGKRCDSNVIVTFNGPHDSTGHPFRITNNCYPPSRGFYPYFKGCTTTPGCVASAKQLHSFPRDAAIAEPKQPPAHGSCGSFADPFDSYWVSVGGGLHTSCTTALALAHAISWRTVKTRSPGGGTSFVISGFPGWQCSSGMGESICIKDRQRAQFGYQNMIRWAYPNR